MLYYLALLSIFTSAIIAVYNWKVQKGALYVAGILGILSAYALTHYYSSPAESDYIYALLYGTLSPLWLLPGPLLYFYFRIIFQKSENKRSVWNVIHFIPFVIHFINIIPYIISPFEYKLSVAHAIHQDLNNLTLININSLYSFKTAFLIRPILLLGYLFWCTITFLKHYHLPPLRTRIWLICFLFSLLISTLIYLYFAISLFEHSVLNPTLETSLIYYASAIAYIILPILLILFFPEVLYGINKSEEEDIEENSKVIWNEIENHKEIAKQINEYLLREKPYLNPDFELKDLADALQIPTKQVSFACKQVLGTKFTDLRAQLRVEYVKVALQQGNYKNSTIGAVGIEAGFKSRSAYYDAFKAATGMTPSQYLGLQKSKKA